MFSFVQKILPRTEMYSSLYRITELLSSITHGNRGIFYYTYDFYCGATIFFKKKKKKNTLGLGVWAKCLR